MTEIDMQLYTETYEFPSKQEPEWRDKIERWYQLDAAAYGLVNAVAKWKVQPAPGDTVIVASPGASNVADYDFVQTGAISASKFVHTLPNIRVSPFCQITNWSGKVLCLQRDPETFASGLLEGVLMLSPKVPTVWVFSIVPGCPNTAHGLKLSLGKKSGAFTVKTEPGPAKNLACDQELIDWLLHERAGQFQLADNVMLFRG